MLIADGYKNNVGLKIVSHHTGEEGEFPNWTARCSSDFNKTKPKLSPKM